MANQVSNAASKRPCQNLVVFGEARDIVDRALTSAISPRNIIVFGETRDMANIMDEDHGVCEPGGSDNNIDSEDDMPAEDEEELKPEDSEDDRF